MAGYRLSRQAAGSVDDIYDYTAARWGPSQADRYVDALEEAFQRIALDPGLGRRRSDLPPSLLAMTVGSHVIVYAEMESMVAVIDVLHVAMDIPGRIAASLRPMGG